MNAIAEKPQNRVATLGVTVVPATLATAALILLMQSLIATDVIPPEIKKREKIVYVGKVPEMSEPQRTEPPNKPKEVTPTPERRPQQVALRGDTSFGAGPSYTPPAVTTGGIQNSGTNMVVPFLKLQPEYPSRALSRGIEGFVDLSFDITAAGTTTNIRVIGAEPEGVFERAAIRALERWKYRVPVNNGVPQGQVDMMTRMSFALEK